MTLVEVVETFWKNNVYLTPLYLYCGVHNLQAMRKEISIKIQRT